VGDQNLYFLLQQFFPEHMVETKMSSRDDTNGLLTHSERYKNLLLQVCFVACLMYL